MDLRTIDYAERLSRLIRHKTVSDFFEEDKTKYYELQDTLKALFPTLFKVGEYQRFDGSFLLKWPGRNNLLEPILMMNHQDVVAAEGDWQHDPFGGEIVGNILWGRGTLDTKGGLFCMLQAAEELARLGWKPERDIYFESSCNEEVDGTGAKTISTILKLKGMHFYMILDEGGMIMYDPIGGADGTFAMVGLGEKAYADIRFVAKSNGGHASTPVKDTPLVRLGKFMADVDKNIKFEAQLSEPIKVMFTRMSKYMKGPVARLLGNADKIDKLLERIVPSVSATAAALMKTTIAFTMAQGSEGTNVLPQEAWVIANMRFSHHEGIEKSLAKVKAFADKYDIEMVRQEIGVESKLTSPDSPAFKCIEDAVKASYPGVETVPYIMTGASDLRFFDSLSENCFHFVPFIIDEQQLASIHGLNENVNIDCLAKAVDFYQYLYKNN